jgi:hypothetical protein
VSRCLHFSHAAQRRAQRRVSAILNKRQEILSSPVAVHPLWAPHEHFFRGKQSLWSSSSLSTALLRPVTLPNGLDTITSFRANAFHSQRLNCSRYDRAGLTLFKGRSGASAAMGGSCSIKLPTRFICSSDVKVD